MTPEIKEALDRLKAAVTGKQPTHGWQGKTLTVATVEIDPRDVIAAAKGCAEEKVAALASGSVNTVASVPDVRTVGLHVKDVLHLIREVEKTTPPASPAAVPPKG